MKILFYLRIVVMGGAERYLLTLLPEFKKRGIEVGFFCTRQSNNAEIIDYFTEHFKQYEIPIYTVEAPSSLSLKAAKKLSQVIKDEGYTILSTHLIHAEIISVLSKMVYKTSCKLIVTKHGYLQKFMDKHGFDYTKINKLGLTYQVSKFLQRYITNNFAVSKGLADFYVLSGICQPQKIAVIYHGLPINFCNDSPAPIRYSDSQILIIGRLRRLKGHHLLIEAVKLIYKEIPSLKLIILGEGEEKEALVKLVKDYGLQDYIIFVGYNDNVCNYIHGSDIVVAPSMAEAFGLIVLEAYSCSKPVIAFNVTAFNENIDDNETGCLVKPYDVNELAQKIKYLVQNKNIAISLGIKGKKLLNDKFSLGKSISATIDFFRNV